MATPDDRVERERALYNEGRMLAASSALHRRFNNAFEGPNTRYGEAHWEAHLARVVPGNSVLEVGCFDGYHTAALRRLQPARLVAIDVSDVAVRKAAAEGIDARRMDAHRLEFPDASFDAVVGRAILHHLRYEVAVREVHRVLRPGGTAIFMEPLRDNPAWKLFRALTPDARTPDELPLSRVQVRLGDAMFSRGQHCFIGLASTLAGVPASFLGAREDNPVSRLCDRLDRAIERTPLRYWMRYVILVWEK